MYLQRTRKQAGNKLTQNEFDVFSTVHHSIELFN